MQSNWDIVIVPRSREQQFSGGRVNWTAVASPMIAAAAALAGVALGALLQGRREERRATRSMRLATYTNWLRFTESLGTWAFQAGADFSGWQRKLYDTKAELDLVASSGVNSAVLDYIDQLDRGARAVATAVADSDDHKDDAEVASAAGAAFARAMERPRTKVIQAMRQDLGLR
jgi:hypothetical protein